MYHMYTKFPISDSATINRYYGIAYMYYIFKLKTLWWTWIVGVDCMIEY